MKDETGTFAVVFALGIACLVVAAVACVLYVEEANRHRNTIGGNGESFVDSMYEGINDAIESVETIIAIEEELGSYIVEAVNNDATDEGGSGPVEQAEVEIPKNVERQAKKLSPEAKKG